MEIFCSVLPTTNRHHAPSEAWLQSSWLMPSWKTSMFWILYCWVSHTAAKIRTANLTEHIAWTSAPRRLPQSDSQAHTKLSNHWPVWVGRDLKHNLVPKIIAGAESCIRSGSPFDVEGCTGEGGGGKRWSHLIQMGHVGEGGWVA